MKRTLLLIVSLWLTLNNINGQGIAEKSFSQFTWINTGSHDISFNAKFGYELNSFTVVNKRCDELPETDPCYEAYNSLETVLLGRYKDASMSESVNILYSPGPSIDPTFKITDKDNHKVIWEYVAEELCIASSGIIYTAGSINKMFQERTKWRLFGGRVQEVQQPYLYVGLKGKLLCDVKLYSEKTGGQVVATLPKGYEIEILLADMEGIQSERGISSPKNYLARSAFGLIGWLRLTEAQMYGTPVLPGLLFHGD
jgi:hypothetical protein